MISCIIFLVLMSTCPIHGSNLYYFKKKHNVFLDEWWVERNRSKVVRKGWVL